MRKLICFAIVAALLSTTSYSQSTSNSDNEGASSNAVEVDGKIFEKVEREAKFPGGQEAWSAYLQNNLNANVPIKKRAPVGSYQVVIRFVVTTDGSIKNIEAETNHGYGMEKEVIRIISKCPKWIPAQQKGRPVNAYRRQPITFVVPAK